MKAVEQPHALPEDLMAYLDGELAPERALAVHAHLAQCPSCEALTSELRDVSRDMALWQVTPPEPSLQAPAAAVSVPRESRSPLAWLRTLNAWQSAAAAAIIVLGTGLWFVGGTRGRNSTESQVAYATRHRAVEEAPMRMRSTMATTALEAGSGTLEDTRAAVAAQPSRPPPMLESQRPVGTVAVRTQKIIRTVTMTIVAKEFDTVRDAIDRLVGDMGGFVGHIQASDTSSERAVRVTLRVPATRLDEAVRSLKTLGHVISESQTGDDVTEQVRDVEARLSNSRNTEKRLSDVLRNRTGRVSDVLEVEREIARVREEIERMDAQRLNLERQVEYSTVSINVTERREATLDLGPTPIRTQLRNAGVDGIKEAYETGVGAVVWLLRVAPVLLLWAALLWWPVRILYRTVRTRTA